MNKNTSASPSSRWAHYVAAGIFTVGGLVLMIHGLSSGWGDFFEGVVVLGIAWLIIRESRKDKRAP